MSKQQPPKWALKFLKWFCKEDYLSEIEGDLNELFHIRAKTSIRSARLFFVWSVIRTFRPMNLKESQNKNWNMTLISNYAKIYFRRFKNETLHYGVNILGLGLGFAVLFFILLFVHDEQHIDAYHSKSDRIFRVIEKSVEDDGTHRYFDTPSPLANALKADFPSIEATARMTYFGSQVVTKGEVSIADRDWAVATKSIFNILDFDIIDGNPMKPFQGEAGLVLTKDAAIRLFGTMDVVGEVVDESRFGKIEVLAVMNSMPKNSSYQFDEIYVADFKFSDWSEWFQKRNKSWDSRFVQTWVLLKEGSSKEAVLASKDAFIEKYYKEEIRAEHDFDLQLFKESHLHSAGIENGGPSPLLSIPHSNQQFVSMILLMGFLVIFIAALNYINLSSVYALKRTLEASMRKINGASNKQLIFQLFFETLLTILIAYSISLLLIVLFFPYFLEIANKEIELSLLFSEAFLWYHTISIVLIWILSAAIPAIYYSKLKRPLLVLKNAFSGKGDLLRKFLVGIQYALSLFLIIGSITIYRQLNFVQNKDLGFNRENLIVLDINSGTARRNFKNILAGIKNNPNVLNASTSSRVPGEWKNLPTANLSDNLTDGPTAVSHYAVDKNWLDTYKINLAEGRNFSGTDQTDSLHIIINQKTVDVLNLKNPLGTSLWVNGSRDSVRMKVIGVIEDFHFESLYEPIGPVVLTHWNNHIRSIDYFTIRYKQRPNEVLTHIENVNAKFDPNTPAEFNFLDEKWKRYYKAEQSRSTIILIASAVSVMISAFGLFGLINFTAERKTKEIGIRKVVGASVQNIVTLILKDYVIILMLSLTVALPVSIWILGEWLSDFAYRIDLSADIFLFAFVLVLLLSFSTVLIKIFKIATSNPVNALKCE